MGHTPLPWTESINGLVSWKIYRKAPYFMGKSMVSCKFSRENQTNQSTDSVPRFQCGVPCVFWHVTRQPDNIWQHLTVVTAQVAVYQIFYHCGYLLKPDVELSMRATFRAPVGEPSWIVERQFCGINHEEPWRTDTSRCSFKKGVWKGRFSRWRWMMLICWSIFLKKVRSHNDKYQKNTRPCQVHQVH